MAKNKILTEGSAKILITPKTFYNPAQVVNRDLSVAFVTAFGKLLNDPSDTRHKKFTRRTKYIDPLEKQNKLVILDALSATGIRAIRYQKEIPLVCKITANDLSSSASSTITENISLNNLKNSSIDITTMDAIDLLRCRMNEYNVIDLDPYGTSAPFIRDSVSSIQDGGLLCLNFTDMRNFVRKNGATCWVTYGSMNSSKAFVHEMALRTILGCIDRNANAAGRYIEPLGSFSINFYVRVFVRVFQWRKEANNSCIKNGMVFVCRNCHFFIRQPMGNLMDNGKFSCDAPVLPAKCELCGGGFDMHGPLWISKLHSNSFLERVWECIDRLPLESPDQTKSLISLALEEVEDSLFYIDAAWMCKKLSCTTPNRKILGCALANSGYAVSRCHIKPELLKTNAPMNVIWAILQKWAIKSFSKEEYEEKSQRIELLRHEFKIDVDFGPRGEDTAGKRRFTKFVTNRSEWGPLKKV